MADQKKPTDEKQAKDAPVTTVTCPDCGAAISGPDAQSVADAVERHHRATGHQPADAPRQQYQSPQTTTTGGGENYGGGGGRTSGA